MIYNDNIMFIVYVQNQEKSKIFYEHLFGFKPVVDVIGMTEFKLADNVTFGIIPEDGIYKILDRKIKDPAMANGISRCELYLYIDSP